jgi:AraC-like DNA-binding protein
LISESPLTENLQRVGFLSLVPELVRRFGVDDPLEVLSAAGLGRHSLDDPESTIPYAAMGRLLIAAAEKTACPHFGLEGGLLIRTASLGLVGELMRNAPTLGAALLDFATHQHRNAHGGVVYLLTDAHQAFFGYAVYQANVPGNHLICDGAAMAAFNLVRELSDAVPFTALQVLFSRSQPENLIPYQQKFGVQLQFNAEQTAVVLPRKWLDRPVRGADPAIRRHLEHRVRMLWLVGDFDIVTQLRRLLRIGLLKGHVSALSISEQLGVSRRALRRQLNALGLSFQDVLGQTRCEFVKQLLANTRLGICEIGTIVGYTDPSVLTRAFIRWTGVTPSGWREHLAFTNTSRSVAPKLLSAQ